MRCGVLKIRVFKLGGSSSRLFFVGTWGFENIDYVWWVIDVWGMNL